MHAVREPGGFHGSGVGGGDSLDVSGDSNLVPRSQSVRLTVGDLGTRLR